MVAGTGEAPCGVLSYNANYLPAEYRGTLLVTSWGDHRIERYRLEPRGASFRSVMEPVVVGGEDFRPVGIAMAPDGSLYFSDWVDKSYDLHGKGRIWRLRNPGNASRITVTVTNKSISRTLCRPWLAPRPCDTRPTRPRRASCSALETDDLFLQQAAREGLKRSLPFTEIMDLAADPVPAHRLAALLDSEGVGPTQRRGPWSRSS